MNRPPRRPNRTPAGLALALLAAAGAHAQMIDVSQVPLSAALQPVKPNIMFILDDSGSMGLSYMPDDVAGLDSYGQINNYGYFSSQCNGVAYNPDLTYQRPVRADGTLYPNASPTAAPSDGFSANPSTVDLTDGSQIYFRYDRTISPPAPDAMSWTYLADGTVDRSTPFYQECMRQIGSPLASNGRFQLVRVNTQTSADQLQNYANWYAYYRTRRLLMRSATGLAFRSVTSAFRVGMTVISDPGVTSASFLPVEDFEGAHRAQFYRVLYEAATGEGFTPLRGALSKVGRYYANQMPGQASDPVKHSCQRNYALLSTDGYWNTGQSGYPGQERDDYGPFQLDGRTPVGQQDGAPTDVPTVRDSSRGGGAGDSNSLADVAQYYWKTPLRTGTGWPANVPASARETALDPDRRTLLPQHVTTFTVGLGVRGTLAYDRNYPDQKQGDFFELSAGRKQWPVPVGTREQNKVNATHIDDLWHAAVNGRGLYFSALDPTSLSSAISSMLSEISKESGSGSAAAASSLTPVVGDNWLFLPSYSNAPSWHGDLRAFQFETDNNNGLKLPNTRDETKVKWSAARKLDTRDLATQPRAIKFGGRDGKLVDFSWANLQQAGYTLDFNVSCAAGASPRLSQCDRITAAARERVTPANLVAFLGGSTTLEMDDDAPDIDQRVFRSRVSRLGDIINAAPVYLGKPPFKYADAGYAQFVAQHAQRRRMVYAAANDGMLHAFEVGSSAGDADGGVERWAFVPRGVMSNLWRLADADYDASHRAYLDATPTIGDIHNGREWRTILVGGMGAGGRYYYALDITDPLSPELLWEFVDGGLGLTFGNPVITKNAAGTWVVAFTSGVNNDLLDGKGRLYVLNAWTGSTLASIPTSAGTTAAPSNLGRLNAWVTNETDNTALRYYAGDMQGNMWRFDPDNLTPPAGTEAVLLGQALTEDGTPQPITGKPVLTEMVANGGQPVAVVAFGTGRFMNLGDLASTTVQTIYAIKDPLDGTGLGPLRQPAARLVRQRLGSNRLIAQPASLDWNAQNGWYVDLDVDRGERVVLDGIPLADGVLGFVSTKPNGDPCSGGGTSYLYQFVLKSGQASDVYVSDSLISGISRVADSNGMVNALITRRDQTMDLEQSGGEGGGRRPKARYTAWRELN